MRKMIIGIDPDVDKSGIAILLCDTNTITVDSLKFPLLLDRINECNINCQTFGNELIVIVEAGWLVSTHYHLKSKDNARISAAKGNSVGRNHEVGRKIVEMCQHWGIKVIEQRPLRKHWRGKDGKITHEELSYFISGLPTRTNQEMRDACLLAWCEAGFPIRVKPIKSK